MKIISTNVREDGTLEIFLGVEILAEIANGKTEEEFVEEILSDMGYVWNSDGTITEKY